VHVGYPRRCRNAVPELAAVGERVQDRLRGLLWCRGLDVDRQLLRLLLKVLERSQILYGLLLLLLLRLLLRLLLLVNYLLLLDRLLQLLHQR